MSLDYAPNYSSKMRKRFNELKIKFIYKWIFKELRTLSGSGGNFDLLEVGSGPGVFLDLLSKEFPSGKLHGVDISEDLVRFSRKINGEINYQVGDACNLPCNSSTFDYVISQHVIEHIEDTSNFLEEIKRVLKPGGYFIFCTPNLNCISHRIAGNNWIGFKDPTHVSLKSSKEWRKVISEEGFIIEKDGSTGVRGAGFIRKTPLYLLNVVPLSYRGFFNWDGGDTYVCVSRFATL